MTAKLEHARGLHGTLAGERPCTSPTQKFKPTQPIRGKMGSVLERLSVEISENTE